MKVRGLDAVGDWTFGSSLSNYKTGNDAIGQNIQTRVSSFLGNCFFDLGAGIDWFSFLSGSKSTLALQLAIQAVIINTNKFGAAVTGILQLSLDLNVENRLFSGSTKVQTTYSTTTAIFSYAPGGTV